METPKELTIVTHMADGTEREEKVLPAPKAKIKEGDWERLYLARVRELRAADDKERAAGG